MGQQAPWNTMDTTYEAFFNLVTFFRLLARCCIRLTSLRHRFDDENMLIWTRSGSANHSLFAFMLLVFSSDLSFTLHCSLDYRDLLLYFPTNISVSTCGSWPSIY